jgi:putative DNA primase/helicase
MGPFLARYGAILPDTVIVATPSGGAHVYFTSSAPIKGSSNVLGLVGVDSRGKNGYVLAPGSVGFVDKDDRAKGVSPYRWVSGSVIAPMPAEIEQGLAAPRAGATVAQILTHGGALPTEIGPLQEAPTVAVEWAATESTEEGITALAKACKIINDAQEGTRNDTLFRQCVKLGDLGMMGLLTISDARRAVYACVQNWPDPTKTLATIERAFGRAKAQKIVVIGPDHMRMNDEAISALALHPNVYSIGDRLAVEVPSAVSEDADSVRIRPIGAPTLRELLSRVVSFRRHDAKSGEYKPAHVPDYTPSEILERGYWEGVRAVDGYSLVPVLRPDGSVVREAGYDESTRLYMARSWDEPLPRAEDALALIKHLVKDFPFAAECDLAAWVSACCTPLAMYQFSGPSPLHLFEASRKNSGKSFLASAASMIGAGRPATQEAAWPQGNDAELSKQLLSWAIELNKPVVFFDNVDGEFSSAVLAGFLTSQDRSVSGRKLGLNETFTGKLNTTFLVSANNPSVGTDLERRIVPCRLEPTEDAGDRKFEVGDFLGWVRAHRRTLTLCMLSILQEGQRRIREGARVSGKAAHSFESWSKVVRDPLLALGLVDPWTGSERLGLEEAEQAEDAALSLAETLSRPAAPGRGYGWRSTDLLELLDPMAKPTVFRSYVHRRFPRGAVSAKALGYLLRGLSGVWVEVPGIGRVQIRSQREGGSGGSRQRAWFIRDVRGVVVLRQ